MIDGAAVDGNFGLVYLSTLPGTLLLFSCTHFAIILGVCAPTMQVPKWDNVRCGVIISVV